MTNKEFNKFDKHYNKLVKKGTIKTMNDACIYKLAIEKAIKVMHSCETFYCWDEQALGKDRRCQEECDTCASVRKEK